MIVVNSVERVDSTYKSGVKVTFKHACFCENKLKDSTCGLLISVGQPAHESDKFIATIDAANDSFKECVILVADSLQRYNLRVDNKESFTTVHEKANVLGAQWIVRNEKIINRLEIPHRIIRWDYWLNHTFFAECLNKVNDLYLNDQVFRRAVDDTANLFAQRDHKRFRGINYNYNDVFDSSALYLKEECAAMMLWLTENIDFEIYPRHRNDAMKYVHERLIIPEYGKTLLPLSIRFKELNGEF